MASGRSGGRSSSGGSRSSGGSSSRSSSGVSSSSSFSSSGGGISFGGFSIGTGGAGGGIIQIIMGLVFMLFPMTFFVAGIFMILASTNIVKYDENEFQDYTYQLYEETFQESSAKEDYYLLVLLVEDFSYYDFYYNSWTGDHIDVSATTILGDNDSVLGRRFNQYINSSSYKYSLDTDLTNVINSVTNELISVGNDFYNCEEVHDDFEPKYVNYSNVDLESSSLQVALENFTHKTGIPIYLVVEDIDDVFSKTIDGEGVFDGIMFIVLPLVFVAAGVFLLVSGIRSIKKKKSNSSSPLGGSKASSIDSFESMKDDISDDFKIDPKDY